MIAMTSILPNVAARVPQDRLLVRRRFRCGLAAACLVAVASSPLPAVDFYWNGVGSVGSAGGGSGTWDTTLTNWETAASGGTATSWPASPSGNDDAFFGGTAGTVTVAAGGVGVNDLTFTTAGYTLAGGTLTLGGTTPTITNAVAATITAPLAGSAGLVKAGAGTLTLSAANSYTGTTTIAAGTLALSGGSNRLATTGTLSFSGSGGLDLGGGSQTLTNITVAFGAASGTATLTGGSLVLDGASALNVTPSTTTGGITATVDASGLASLVISKAGQAFTVSGSNSSLNPGNSAQMILSSTSNTITALSVNVGSLGNGTSGLNSGRLDLGAANVINADAWKLGTTRSGGIVAFQAGLTNPTATLRAADGTSRVTTITVGENAAGGTGVGTSHLNFSGGSVDLLVTDLILSRGGSTSTTALTPAVNGSFSMGGGTVDASRIWLSRNEVGGLNSTNTSSFTQAGGTVTAGTLTFGQTTISSGTLLPTFNSQYTLASGTLKAATISAGTGLFSTSTIRRINFNGGTLTHYDASTDLSLNGVAGTGGSIGIVLGTTGSPTILADTGRTVTIGANTAITGSGSLTKTGAGGLVLNGTGGFTGDTRIAGGTLTLGTSSVLSGSTLDMNAADAGTIAFDTITSVTLGGLEGSRPISLQNTAAQAVAVTIGQNNQSTTYSGSLTGGSSLTKVGTGTLTLAGANSFSSSTLTYGASSTNLGAIRLENDAALGGVTVIAGNSGTGTAIAQIQLANDVTISGIEYRAGGRSNQTTSGAAIVNVSGNNTWGGVIGISNTGGNYGIRSDAGTLTISGSLQNGLGTTRTWDLVGAGDIAITGTIVDGLVGFPLILAKGGTGTLTIAGTSNTYTGATTASAGTLKVTGATPAASALSVAAGATLAGTGTVGGAATIAGILAPGNSIGVLAIEGAATMSSGSTFAWELDPTQSNPETARGTAFDGLNAGSTFTGTSSVFEIVLTGTNDFADPFWQQNRTWTTIVTGLDGTTPVSGWATAFGGGFAYSYNGQTAAPDAYGSFSLQDSTLTWTAVPEPGTAGLAAGAVVAALLAWRRRR